MPKSENGSESAEPCAEDSGARSSEPATARASKTMSTVLVIDDNPAVSTALEVLFSMHDLRTLAAESPSAGIDLLKAEQVDVVIQDMNFSADTTSGAEGSELFQTIRERYPELPVILLTAWTQLEAAVELVKGGATDYLAKPWDDRKLLTTVRNLVALAESRNELSRLRASGERRRSDLEAKFDLCGLVFGDPAMERAVALACQVARADVPVLITGPNGAGKEKIAEILRANSSVSEGPFVTVNCGALPAELIEAELFGAEEGAYTGANRNREGKFEAADGGTLFLDEIGNLSLGGQMKLLRVLETGRFEPLGSNQEKEVSVRVISATNADIPAMIADSRFREDLYYRLNTIQVTVPALADRPDDIAPLADHFLASGKRLAASAKRALRSHDWPGNVRELKNALERAALLSTSSEISAADLALPKRSRPSPTPQQALDGETIKAALDRAKGVVAQAADELAVSRQALYRRMQKLGIDKS